MAVRLVIFGRQGAGKGTQSSLLSTHYGAPHISTGDMFRDHKARGTELGKTVDAIMASASKCGNLPAVKLAGAAIAAAEGG